MRQDVEKTPASRAHYTKFTGDSCGFSANPNTSEKTSPSANTDDRIRQEIPDPSPRFVRLPDDFL